ncbi:MAG TPA: YceI family protein [Aquimonas sp.]|jgi:polyisoprenoid-binding protein YceI|nr:YceI family protein [Xanthomonadales bacterium]HRD72203.1 YceI family protein [Aquimonas sp.]HRF53902.1 YceI family protein [Aquimonas sp.]
MRIAVMTVLLFLLSARSLEASEWQVDASQSTLGFEFSYEGEHFPGTFKQFAPRISFDPASATGQFDVTIDLGSSSTDDSEWDSYLHGSNFFAVKTAPIARYRAERFEPSAEGFVAHGELSLRGKTNPVDLRFTWAGDPSESVLDGEASLQRLDFNVGGGEWAEDETIGKTVIVRTHLVLTAQ